MMKKRCLFYLSITSFLVLGPFSTSVWAPPKPPPPPMNCEVPPFVNRAVTPNVLIILDNSGSMKGEDVPGWANRWKAAKDVITRLLSDTDGFNWGLMRMDGSKLSDGRRSKWDWKDPNTGTTYRTNSDFVRHGGKLLRPVGTDKADIIDYVNGMEIYDTIPHTYTTLAETLLAAGQYFADGQGPAGLGTYKGTGDSNYQYSGGGKTYWARDTDDYGNAIDNSSPITDWCQQNFVIFLTDGESNADSDWPTLFAAIGGDYDKDNYFRESHPGDLPEFPDNCDPLGEYNIDPEGPCDPDTAVDKYDNNELINPMPMDAHSFIDDVAKYLYEADLRKDMDGKQNIVTYTVGYVLTDPKQAPVKDLLRRAAEQGGGSYFTADDYDQLRAAYQNIVNDIIQRISSGTAVAVQSTSTQNARRLLRAKFVPEAWTGHLEAFKLPYAQGDVPLWDAGIVLKNTNPDQRYIFTAVDDKNGAQVEMKRKLEFTQANSGTKDADSNKLSDLLEAADDAEAKKIIRYIRGEDVAGYRVRPDGWKLGDIAYSSPVIWGEMVYVGANDGMLHAFDINTGEERWAFIPNNLLAKLKDLTLPEYCHEYFVDLSPKVTEIYVGGFKKTVLVGGQRGGGDFFFALDITTVKDPATVQPMWEFTDSYLGESWTLPTVERCWLGGAERWVAFVGSNFNTKDSKGYLFAVDVVTGQKMGKELQLTGAPENSLPSMRAIDFDQDGYTDKIFVGCLTGPLFLVEIAKNAAADPSTWASDTKHIFTTQKDQPITVPTSLSLYRELGETHVMAYFGTGKYFDLVDKDDKTVQSFYAIKDNAVKVGIGGLADQTDASVCTPIQDEFGWFMDLNKNPGERVISSSLVIGGYVFFATFQPSEDPCEAGGIARLYFVNYDKGCVPAAPIIDINGDNEVTSDDKIGGGVPRSIEIGYGIPSDIMFDPEESTIIIQTSDTTIHVFKVDVGANQLVVESWREVID